MSLRFVLLAAAGAALLAASPASAAFTVDFASDLGDSNPLSVATADSNIVTFDSPSGPGTFTVENTFGAYRDFDIGLGDYLSFSGDTLTISFANPVTQGVSFLFGIEDAFEGVGDDFLTITSNTGVTAVDNGAPDGLTLDNPEGSAYIDAPGATLLTITSANPFAIGNVSVPEPITLSTLGVGLAGLAAARRRRA